ncbi:hypothetical protein T09_14711 [Trichinella sp. T9]|nr:hypothetical protein T09_14711 [Trichinella sp. T9]
MHRWEDSGKSKQWKSPCRRCPPGICKDDGEVRGFPVLRRKEVPRRPPVQRGTILQSSSRTYAGSGHLSDARRGVTRTVLITHGWPETAPKYQRAPKYMSTVMVHAQRHRASEPRAAG